MDFQNTEGYFSNRVDGREGNMNFESIVFEKKDGVARITLNRPEAFNAMNRKMIEEIAHALVDAEKDEAARVVVLTGKGKAFCTGMDLKFVKEELGSLSAQQEFFRSTNKALINAIENLSKPVLAAVNGYALAGGFELMLACDLVIATEDALLGDQHINYGLVGPGGSTQTTPRLIGIRKAKELIFTGDKITGKEAESIGLVNRAVPAEELEGATDEMASKIAEKSPVALKIAKALINRSPEMNRQTSAELEVMSAIVNATSEDYMEGIKAFNEKRKPIFKGK
jgi:enoyl-CoA hydratase/carnithine racemase